MECNNEDHKDETPKVTTRLFKLKIPLKSEKLKRPVQTDFFENIKPLNFVKKSYTCKADNKPDSHNVHYNETMNSNIKSLHSINKFSSGKPSNIKQNLSPTAQTCRNRTLIESKSVDNLQGPSYFRSLSKTIKELNNKALHGKKEKESKTDHYLNKLKVICPDNIGPSNLRSIFAQTLLEHEKHKNKKIKEFQNDISHIQKKPDLITKHVISRRKINIQNLVLKLPLILTDMIKTHRPNNFTEWKEVLGTLQKLDKQLLLEEGMSEEMHFPRVTHARFNVLVDKISKKMEQLATEPKLKERRDYSKSQTQSQGIFLTQKYKNIESEVLHKMKNVGNQAINSVNYLKDFGKLSKDNFEFIASKLGAIAESIFQENSKNQNSSASVFKFCLRSAEGLHNLSSISLKALMKELSSSTEVYGNAVLNSALLSAIVVELMLKVVENLLDHSNSLFKSNEQAKIAKLEIENAEKSEKIANLEERVSLLKATEKDIAEELRQSKNKNNFFEKAISRMRNQMESRSELAMLLGKEQKALNGLITDTLNITTNINESEEISQRPQIKVLEKKLQNIVEVSGGIQKLTTRILDKNKKNTVKSKFTNVLKVHQKNNLLKKMCTDDVKNASNPSMGLENFMSLNNLQNISKLNINTQKSTKEQKPTKSKLKSKQNENSNVSAKDQTNHILEASMNRSVSIRIQTKQTIIENNYERSTSNIPKRRVSEGFDNNVSNTRSGFKNNELLMESMSDDISNDPNGITQFSSLTEEEVFFNDNASGVNDNYFFKPSVFAKRLVRFRAWLTYEHFLKLKTILQLKDAGIQCERMNNDDKDSSISDIGMESFKINILDQDDLQVLNENDNFRPHARLEVPHRINYTQSIAMSMYNLDPNASPESLNIIEKCTEIDNILGQLENVTVSMTGFDSEGFAHKIGDFFNELEENIKDPSEPAKNDFVYHMLAFKLDKLEKIIANNHVLENPVAGGQHQENDIASSDNDSLEKSNSSSHRSMLGNSKNELAPSHRNSRQSVSMKMRRMSLFNKNNTTSKLHALFNVRYHQIKGIIDKKLGDNIGTDKDSLPSFASGSVLNNSWSIRNSRKNSSIYKNDIKKDKQEVLKTAANALAEVMTDCNKSSKQKQHFTISPLAKLLKQIHSYYEKALNTKDGNNINLSFLVVKEIGYKSSIKGSGRKYKVLLYNCLKYFDRSDTVRLFGMFLGLKEYLDEESAKIYFTILQLLRDKKFDVFKEDFVLDQKIMVEILTTALANYKKTYLKEFLKEVEALSIKRGNHMYVPFDTLMIRCLRLKSRMIENVCEFFYNASDMNDDGYMDFNEFWRVTKFIESEFFSNHSSEMVDIFNEFCNNEKCLSTEDFTRLCEKHKIFGNECKIRFLAKVAKKGFVTIVGDLVLFWPRIRNIFLSVNEKINKEGVTEMINLLNKQLLNYDIKYSEDIWLSYKLLEMEIEEHIIKWKIEQTFMCPEFLQFDNIFK
jgi:hypothetical protein